MSGETRSEAFQRFLDSFTVLDRESSEDYDLEALGALEGDELTEAEDLLIRTVQESDDPRAPKALRYMGLQRAVPTLRAAVATRSGEMLVQSAVTLFELTGDASVVAPIARTLRDGDQWARVDAANALAAFGFGVAAPTAEKALFTALNDPDKLVRANAVEGLFHLTGLDEWDTAPFTPLNVLGLRLRSAFAPVRSEAIPELRELIDAKQAGESAADLGLDDDGERSEAVVRFQRSTATRPGSEPWADTFDLAALGEVDDPLELAWAEAALYVLLERSDPRAPGALVAMNAQHARAALREVKPEATGAFADAVAAALARL